MFDISNKRNPDPPLENVFRFHPLSMACLQPLGNIIMSAAPMERDIGARDDTVAEAME